MTTKLGEEDNLRKKVWKIINLIQANQLFVHYKDLSIKYLPEKNKITQTAGILYSSDLIGAWIGGLIVSIVFIPIFGIVITCVIFVVTKLGSLVILQLTK